MFIFYPFVQKIYHSLIKVASIANPKARDFVVGRQTQWSDIETWAKAKQAKKKVWIHAASLGEYEMAKPIINEIRQSFSNTVFVVSFHSPSGYNFAELLSSEDLKIYLPIDLYKAQSKLTDILQPSAVIFIKYEFWYNLLKVLHDKKVPFYFSSIHLEKDSYMFKKSFKNLESYLRKADKLFCHNENSKKILEEKNYDNCVVVGDTRIDQVLENKKETRTLSFKTQRPCICFGSLCKEEFDWASDYINKNSDFNFIVAPHDIDGKTLKSLTSQLNSTPSFYADKKERISNNTLIINTIGDLKYLYAYCDVAYVGGGFSKGPHNLMEPLLIEEGLCIQIKNGVNFEKAVEKAMAWNKDAFSAKAQEFIQKHKAKLDIIIKELDPILSA